MRNNIVTWGSCTVLQLGQGIPEWRRQNRNKRKGYNVGWALFPHDNVPTGCKFPSIRIWKRLTPPSQCVRITCRAVYDIGKRFQDFSFHVYFLHLLAHVTQKQIVARLFQEDNFAAPSLKDARKWNICACKNPPTHTRDAFQFFYPPARSLNLPPLNAILALKHRLFLFFFIWGPWDDDGRKKSHFRSHT